MPLDEFECLVIGNDAAGLWLLTKLYQAYEARNESPMPRMAWVDLGASPRVSFLPVPIAENFGIKTTEKPWSAEMIVPGGSFLWDQASLVEKFPHLQFDKLRAGLFTPGLQQFTLAHQAIKSYPELLDYAGGLWKIFGRARSPQPETVLLGALACTELVHWNPIADIPAAIQKIEVTSQTTPIEEFRVLKHGIISVKFKDAAPILAKKVIFNAPLWQLAEIFQGHDNFFHLLNIDHTLVSKRAHYAFKITAEKAAIPCTLKPLSLLFDVEEIPDVETEVWPFYYSETETAKELTLWATGPREISLEALQDRFRGAVGRMNRLFPFLNSSILQFQVPLGPETCHSSETRREIETHLERHAIETYEQSWLNARTRVKHCFVLGPFLNCHLPYPWGQLELAQKLLKEILMKPKRKPKDSTQNPVKPDTPIPLDNTENIG